MKFRLKLPIVDISWLKALPRQKLTTEVVQSPDSRLLVIMNESLTNLKQRLIIPFDLEAPRYILLLEDQDKQEQIVALHRGILWVDEDRNHAFKISADLWEYLEQLSKNTPLNEYETHKFHAEFVEVPKP